MKVVEKRINFLMFNQYAQNQTISVKDILPPKVSGSDAVRFIIDRTMNTPRDRN